MAPSIFASYSHDSESHSDWVTSPGSFRIRRAVPLVGGPTPPRVVLTLLPEAQEPCRVHTTPISLGIPTRRRYGIRP